MGNEFAEGKSQFNDLLSDLKNHNGVITDGANIFFDEHLTNAVLDDIKTCAGGYRQCGVGKEAWSFQGANSRVMDEYVEKYEQLQDIMSNYLNLMIKDIEAIAKIGEEIKEVDHELKGIWE